VIAVEPEITAVVLLPPEFPTALPLYYAVRGTDVRRVDQPFSLAPDTWVQLAGQVRDIFQEVPDAKLEQSSSISA